MTGSTGYAIIGFVEPVKVSHFTMTHINVLNYENAPKEFRVYGIGTSPHLLGVYRYIVDGNERKLE